jgi:hypothetical protein
VRNTRDTIKGGSDWSKDGRTTVAPATVLTDHALKIWITPQRRSTMAQPISKKAIAKELVHIPGRPICHCQPLIPEIH